MVRKTEKKIIYTVGSAARSQDDFLKVLKDRRVQTLVDVRRFPTSKYEHFKRENLDAFLFSSGIEYVYMGGELGGFRKGGYEAHVKTKEYKQAVKSLEKLAKKRTAVIMCCEKLPSGCHRRYISRGLKKLGWKVVDII
ncbi:DUF488 family protein [bacterium]|nr:DUF488 family protein [bacterium]NIN92762.1 DUF488 family protein [bacterium]NIO18743.1 DUF488 family protein [bacterium]NIO73819.1 DUF488 family protein [bacterium]